MAATDTAELAQLSPLARLLAQPRYEVIPVKGIEDKLGALPAGATVTVTASPAHGIERTVEVATALARGGYHTVPHLAARMIAGAGQLDEVTGRLAAAGIDEAFVVGGDATPPAGAFGDAGDLLGALRDLPGRPFSRIGIGGYPEGHPLIPQDRLLAALRRKAPDAAYIATQICFDAEVLARWVRFIREAGIDAPVVVGLPGVVARRKLAEISLQTGVGASLRYLTRHGREVARLARSRRYDPTPLARAVAAHADDPALRIEGVHLFTFNQVEATEAWVRATAAF
jgi:methylenetetrahydrofolate reductase (NADPH)